VIASRTVPSPGPGQGARRHTARVPARVGDPVLVLIHSPLVGPATWVAVADELVRRGREAVVPSLLGVAAAPASQWRHVSEVVRAATANTAAPVVLVGHSGAGLLLPAIADALTVEVAALVFVDSFLPPANGSVRLAPPGHMDQLRALASDGVLPPWSSWFGEDAMRELVPDDRLRATVTEEMPRLPLSYFEASVSLPGGWRARPCAYLLLATSPTPRAPPRPANRAGRWPSHQAPDTWRWPATRSPSPTRCWTSNARSAERDRAPHFRCSSQPATRSAMVLATASQRMQQRAAA
jgi:hypothetical protein